MVAARGRVLGEAEAAIYVKRTSVKAIQALFSAKKAGNWN